jgi:hypothetical protein
MAAVESRSMPQEAAYRLPPYGRAEDTPTRYARTLASRRREGLVVRGPVAG